MELAYDLVSGAPGEALDRFPLPALATLSAPTFAADEVLKYATAGVSSRAPPSEAWFRSTASYRRYSTTRRFMVR